MPELEKKMICFWAPNRYGPAPDTVVACLLLSHLMQSISAIEMALKIGFMGHDFLKST